MSEETILRVAARFQKDAREFTSPEALREYLHDHPNADKSKHTVAKPGKDKDHGDEGGGEPKEHDEHGDDHKEAPKKSWKDRLKGLSEKATNFVKNAPKAVHKFIEDDSFRRKSLQTAHKALMEAPEKFAKSAIDTVKHEVKEYKEAGQGIAAMMKGQKMNPHQKKALKTVATHMAIGIAAAALTATGGPLAAAGVFGKGLAKHVAMKSVSNMLGHAHVLEELGHIGHGVKHLMEHLAAEKKKPSVDEVIQNLVVAAVAKELEGLSDEDIKKALEGMDDEEDKPKGKDKKTAMQVASAAKVAASWKASFEVPDILPMLEEALEVHTELHKWASHFPAVLRVAEQEADGLPPGWVWQDRFVRFFEAYDAMEAKLQGLDDGLMSLARAQSPASILAKVARSATSEPPKARVTYAISDFQFFEHPELGRDHIAYEVGKLKTWAQAFDRWGQESSRMLQTEIRQADR